jgi:dienelactone hydrolase
MREVALLVALLFLSPASIATAADEVSASVTLPDRQIRAEGKLVASTQSNIRSVIVIMRWGVGGDVYEDAGWRELAKRLEAAMLLLDLQATGEIPVERVPPEKQLIRNAAVGGGDALVALLDRFAQLPGYAAVKRAPLLLWGFSASGSFGTTFAASRPARTIGFVRYHSHARSLPVNMTVVGKLPALIIAGGGDKTAGVDDARELSQKGRHAGAPWTFAIHPHQQHGRGLSESKAFMLAWVEAVMRQRLERGAALGGPAPGWIGDANTGRVFSAGDYPGSPQQATWLPDERTAKLWQALIGGDETARSK